MRADRLISIVMLLQTRGKMTTTALAEELAVSRRTILRDVDALSGAGIPIYSEGGHGGGVALDEKYRTSLTGLKEAEVRTLFLSANNTLLDELGLGDAAESMLLKVFAALPTMHQSSVDFIRQRIHIDPLWWWYDSQPLAFLAELQQAVYEDRQIQVIYENYAGEVVERVLEPYSLVAKSSLWYLVAQRDGEFRIYRVSRFQQVNLLDTRFQRSPDFDLGAYWRGHTQDFVETLGEYTCTLKVHTQRMNFIQWLMPGRYQIVEAEGEWNSLWFQLESVELAKMLVFGLGEYGEIIEPPELQASVEKTARHILRFADNKLT